MTEEELRTAYIELATKMHAGRLAPSLSVTGTAAFQPVGSNGNS